MEVRLSVISAMFVLPMLCPTHMYLIKSQILQTPSLQENHLILLALACHVILIYCSIFPGLGADGNCFSGLLLWRSDFMHKPRDRLYWLQNEITASFSTLMISLPHHPKSFFVSHLDTMLSHVRDAHHSLFTRHWKTTNPCFTSNWFSFSFQLTTVRYFSKVK